STGWQTIVGIQGQNAAGQNSWQGAVTITESGLGERGKWVKFSGKALMNGTGRTRGVVWISTRGATGSGTPGYDLYIDDIVITDVTDAQTALDVADASTTAVSGLTTRVTNAETKITAHSQQITSLQSSLSGKADAGALNTLSSRVTSAEGKIESTASGLTSLNSTVGSLSSTVQAQGQTLSDTNGKVNSTYSIKVETNNGKKVGAGIVLGSDGSTSDMILYADRFSLFNRNSKAAVPVMIAEGNELFIDTARIKNSSIGMAKISHYLQSDDWVPGQRGWAINKGGGSEFNNVIVRGEVHANSGKFMGHIEASSGSFKGRLEAQEIIGDVAVQRAFNSGWSGSSMDQTKTYYYRGSGYPMTLICQFNCYGKPAGGSAGAIIVTITINGNAKKYTYQSNSVGSNQQGSGITAMASHAVNIGANTNNNSIAIRIESTNINPSGRIFGSTIITATRSNDGAFWEG
ncbi:TPA: DUF1983 domain-containing protein, partial [Klebsiella michiganensis]|nr:DUF1983 domain-containing protein [Klebsiella michiganensis]